jgi:hypothetical protein
MTSSLSDYTGGHTDLPFMVELTKNVILTGLQAQVETPIDPSSLAYDEAFEWVDGQMTMAVTFRDGYGFARARLYIQPSLSDEHDVCFLVDAEFLGYMPSTEGLN